MARASRIWRNPRNAALLMKVVAEVPRAANSRNIASAIGRSRALLVNGNTSQKNLATCPVIARGVTVRADVLTTTPAGWVAGWTMKTCAMLRVTAASRPSARGGTTCIDAMSHPVSKSVVIWIRTRAVARRTVLIKVNAFFTPILPANTRSLQSFAVRRRRLDAWGCPRRLRSKACASGIRPTTTALPNLRILATCSMTGIRANPKAADVARSKVNARETTPPGCPKKTHATGRARTIAPPQGSALTTSIATRRPRLITRATLSVDLLAARSA